MTTYEDLVDATLAARRDAGGGAAAEDHHARRRGGRRRHRGDVVPPRPGARHDARARRAAGDGRVVTCTARQRARGLFFGFPELLRHARLRAARQGAHDAGEAVRARSSTCGSPIAADASSQALRERLRAGDADFVDGTVFAPRRDVPHARRASSTTRRTSATTPTSASTTARSREKREDYLTAHDYMWRWDTDWFWCSKNVGAQNPLVRGSTAASGSARAPITKIMRWNSRAGHDQEARARCSACTPNR